jgi:hypothetical protein
MDALMAEAFKSRGWNGGGWRIGFENGGGTVRFGGR